MARADLARAEPARAGLVGVAPERAALLWPSLSGLVERALGRGNGGFAAADIAQAVGEGRMQLWLAMDDGVDGLLVTQIAVYPRRRHCVLVLAALRDGSRRGWPGWLPALAVLEAWARAQGCQGMELFGRPGWARVLGDDWRRRSALFKPFDEDGDG